MTQEEKARAYDEALKKARFYHGNCPSEPERKKLEGMFPVLRVSEDEEMLQTIIRGFENWKSNGKETFNFTNVDDILAYLEKQKENIEKEYVFRPLAGTDINTAILQAIRRANEGEHLVLAFNGAYIPVRKGCNANKIVDIYDTFIEKQKEQKPADDKAFEEWIDDWWKHNKVNNPDSYDKGDEIQFDHKGFVSFCKAYCYPQNFVLHDTFGYEEGRQTGQNEGVKLVLNNPEKYGLQKEQKPDDDPLDDSKFLKGFDTGREVQRIFDEPKPAEWSEEDEDNLHRVIRVLEDNDSDWKELSDWLKSLRPSWKPSEEQMEALERASTNKYLSAEQYDILVSLYENLKKL